MAYSSSKHHVGINGEGYTLSQKNGIRYYQKKRAPSFVNKYGGGDVAYRDATFWQYMAQTNWRNGSKQLKWDDPGKFWKSSDVNTTQLEELTLSKKWESAGQMISGGKVNTMEAWRASTSWWNANYGYRQQITITNGSSSTVPANYPVKITIDTAALQTASKVRSDRKDWRVVYWNGSSWTDLTRDYVAAAVTFFPTQATIAAGATDSNYYVYYGYSSESTDKQPSTEATWNEVYGFFGTTPDANSKAIVHMREGSGTSLNDDTTNSNTGTLVNSPTWGTDGKFGRYVYTNGTNDYFHLGSSSDFSLGSFTVEGWVYLDSVPSNGRLFGRKLATHSESAYEVYWNGSKWVFSTRLDDGYAPGYDDWTEGVAGEWNLTTGAWHHVAFTYDGSTTKKVFVDGTEEGSHSYTLGIGSSTENFAINAEGGGTNPITTARYQHWRVSNTARSSFPYVLSAEPSTSYGTEISTQPASSTFDLYGGGSDGKVYKWDGTTTWTEQFDCRRITWFESGTDENLVIGDTGGTETAQGQSFTVPAACTIKGLEVYLKKSTGTPGDITVRIETNSTDKPSGTLADANATATISSFSTTDYAWKTVEFTNAFALSSGTTYWIVLKTAASSNDNYYHWAGDGSSPTFSAGTMATSTDGGSTWSAVTSKDAYFRIKGQDTEVNCMKVSSVGGTQKLYVGTGDPDGITNGDARLYSYDGTTWALTKMFSTSTESVINSIDEYVADSKVYIGIGPQAKVYSTSDFSTFTVSKDINIPQNPGYIYALKEYNSVMHAGGGSPEFLPSQFYNGFLNTYDTTVWRILYPFDFTVVKSLEFYDAYLFAGTYRGDLYVYDTSTLNPLFNLRDQYNYYQEIRCMKYFDDKLYIGTYPQEGSNDTNASIWTFDRHGLSQAHTISGVNGYRCFAVVNGAIMVGTGNDGYVYKLSTTQYASSGWYQSSYFDANLPSISKLYNSVTIRHDPLAEGQSIIVYYRFKEADAWTTLGTSNTVGAEEKVLSFPSGTDSKKISLKVELTTTNTSTTPKLTEVIMQYAIYPELKWQWTMRIKAKDDLSLLDRTTDSRTASQIRTALEGLMDSQTLYTFTDIDETSYSVLINDIDQSSWVVNKDTANEDEIIISLLEA